VYGIGGFSGLSEPCELPAARNFRHFIVITGRGACPGDIALSNRTRSKTRVSTAERVVGSVKALQQLLENCTSVIVDSCQDAILAKTLDGFIVAWNPAAECVYGYSAQEVIGKHVSILFPPDRQNEVDAILEKIRRGERVEHYESVRLRKDCRRIDV